MTGMDVAELAPASDGWRVRPMAWPAPGPPRPVGPSHRRAATSTRGPVKKRTSKLTRPRVALLAVSSAALLVFGAPAAHAGNRLYVGNLSYDTTAGGPPPLVLVADVDPDGTARGSVNPQSLALADFNALNPEPGTARVVLADVDGDGRRGLAELTGDLRDVRTGVFVPMKLTTVGADIDGPGTYVLTMRIDEVSVTFEAFAAYGTPGHPDFAWYPTRSSPS